jgi:hypothetical protein
VLLYPHVDDAFGASAVFAALGEKHMQQDIDTETLLNERLFTMNASDWAAFVKRLDEPPPPNAKLKALLARTPIWSKRC